MAASKKSGVLDVEGSVLTLPDGDPASDALVQAVWVDQQDYWSTQYSFSGGFTNEQGNFAFSLADAGDELFDEDGNGKVLFLASAGGDFYGQKLANVKQRDRLEGVTIVLRQMTSTGTAHAGQPVSDPAGTGFSDQALGEIAAAIGSLNNNGSGARGAGDLDSIFNDAVFQILGQRVRLDQPRDLQMAFERSFVETEVDGRSEMAYRGTSGAVALSGESGNVRSGLQAVAYRDAQSGLATVRQTLMELEADNDDEQDLFLAQRDVVERKLTELVSALGQNVRPPIARVDGIFTLLIGTAYDRSSASLTKLGTLVGFAESEALLHELLGTGAGGSAGTADDVTRDDDLVSTRFIEVASYVTGVFLRWEIVRNQLGYSGGTVPLGTKLDVLGRLLDRLDEETGSLDTALTRNGIDDAQREFLEIASDPLTSLAELMRWLQEFSVEGKSYDSGPGLAVVQTTAGEIQPLIDELLDQIEDFPELDQRTIVQSLSQLSRVLTQIQDA
ncbi:MAG TPA: hypothetical protein VFP05_12710 [Thermomicrobiales bacterium]|nr:hypothetical protein [Thermomicrobiales bacterium]